MKEDAMRTSIPLLLLLLCAGLVPAMAGEGTAALSERQLLQNLSSDIPGIRESTALTLGEVRFERAVIPLLRVLHDSPSATERTVAALALCKIGDARGLFAVKQAVRFDESDRVQRLCAWFYSQHNVKSLPAELAVR
jgi:HEAT repeat protein